MRAGEPRTARGGTASDGAASAAPSAGAVGGGAASGPAAGGLTGGEQVDSTALAERIATIASDRKAIDIRLLDLRGIVSYTDWFVVCSGNSERQAKAIHDAVHKQLKDGEHLLPQRVEGEREARWILMDYLDCVVHVFTPQAREFYRLEQLWGEAPSRSVE